MTNQTLSKSSTAVVNEILNFNLEKVEQRLVSKYSWSEPLAKFATMEYKKFIALQVLTNEHQPMFSVIVDSVWHNHILFTKDYTEFCLEVFGHYLHHEPNDNGKAGNGAISFDTFEKAYEKHFGSLPKIWTAQTNEQLCQPTGEEQLCQPTGEKQLCQPTGVQTLCQPTGDKNLCQPTGKEQLCQPTGK